MVRPNRRERLRRYAVLSPLLILLVLWCWVFWAEGAFKGGVGGKAFGADAAMFFSASHLMHAGGNPYDHMALFRAETALMHSQHLPVTHKEPVVRVGNPPLFFWAITPLAEMPFAVAGMAWVVGLFVLSLIGGYVTLRSMGWRTYLIPLLYFAMMPPVILGAFYGNVISLVFFGLAVALPLLEVEPIAAGALMTVAWLKPPVALPIAVLMVLFLAPKGWRVAAGFVGTSVVLVGLTLATTGAHSMVWWAQGLIGYSNDMGIQPDVASLSGLYVRVVGAHVRLAIEVVSLAVAGVVTLVVWWRRRGEVPVGVLAVGWLWFVWLLATPYAHFFDLMLLTLPVVALLGRNGERAARWLPATVLYLVYIDLFLINPVGEKVYILPLPLVVAGYLVYRARRLAEMGEGSAGAL